MNDYTYYCPISYYWAIIVLLAGIWPLSPAVVFHIVIALVAIQGCKIVCHYLSNLFNNEGGRYYCTGLAIKLCLQFIDVYDLNYAWWDAVKKKDTDRLLLLKKYYATTSKKDEVTKDMVVQVAKKGNLTLLKWLKLNYCDEDFICPQEVYNVAYNKGHLGVMKWALKNGCLASKGEPFITKADNPKSKKWEEDNRVFINQIIRNNTKENTLSREASNDEDEIPLSSFRRPRNPGHQEDQIISRDEEYNPEHVTADMVW